MHLPRSSYCLPSSAVHQSRRFPLRVELAALIVEAVDDFVSDDHADGAVVHGIIFRGIEKRRLQNSGREVNGVQLRIVIGVDGGRSHRPLGAIDGLADLCDPAFELE